MVAAVSRSRKLSFAEIRLQLLPLLGLRAHEDGLHGLTKVKAHPVVFAVANLFFCGYCDHLIRGAEGAHYLAVFVGVTAVLSAIVYVGLFMRHSSEILTKTIVLPVSAPARFLFAWWDIARRQLFIALLLTDVLFFTIIYRSPLPAFLLLALIIDVQLVIAAIMTRTHGGMAQGLVVGCIVVSVCVLAASTLFHLDLLGGRLPVVGWVTGGILDARAGNPSAMGWAFAKLAAVAGISVWIGMSEFIKKQGWK